MNGIIEVLIHYSWAPPPWVDTHEWPTNDKSQNDLLYTYDGETYSTLTSENSISYLVHSKKYRLLKEYFQTGTMLSLG